MLSTPALAQTMRSPAAHPTQQPVLQNFNFSDFGIEKTPNAPRGGPISDDQWHDGDLDARISFQSQHRCRVDIQGNTLCRSFHPVESLVDPQHRLRTPRQAKGKAPRRVGLLCGIYFGTSAQVCGSSSPKHAKRKPSA